MAIVTPIGGAFSCWRGQMQGIGRAAMIRVGTKVTTLPSREIDPKTASKIRKDLGLK